MHADECFLIKGSMLSSKNIHLKKHNNECSIMCGCRQGGQKKSGLFSPNVDLTKIYKGYFQLKHNHLFNGKLSNIFIIIIQNTSADECGFAQHSLS